jgi:NAD(P)-dependent dehydrogenase (short-subunit alcohol dehydrogenase family)
VIGNRRHARRRRCPGDHRRHPAGRQEATAAEIGATGIYVDVRDADSVAGLARAAVEEFGAVHVVGAPGAVAEEALSQVAGYRCTSGYGPPPCT